MSVHVVYKKEINGDRVKFLRPVLSREEYMAIRNSEDQINKMKRIRAGEENLKFFLEEMNYSCLPNEDGSLRGSKRMSNSVGMDIDHIPADKMQETKEHILSLKDELGLLMMEESARGEGYHLVFKRRAELTQEENLKWAANLLGVEFDKKAKDFTRVFFTTTEAELIFLSPQLFELKEEKSEELRVKSEEGLARRPEGESQSKLPTDNSQLTTDSKLSTLNSELQKKVLPAIFMLCNDRFPHVPEGFRNDTLYAASRMLRYICDFNEEKMKALLFPEYSLGLDEAEVDKTIRSALMSERGMMPKALKQILSREGMGGDKAEEQCGNLAGNPYSIYPSLSSCVLDDLSMPRLPRWVELLLKVVQPGYRFITIAGCSTAMMTLLSDVTKKWGTKKEARLNGWTHWDGLSGSGKRQLKMVIDLLHRHIEAEDERRRAMVNEIITYNKTAADGEKKQVPPLLQRLLECDTTRKAHIQQMDELKGKKTYTFAEELSSLNLNKGGYYYRGDFCRLLFDNGGVGSMNATGESLSLKTPCNWDVTTTSTHDQTIRQWGKEVQNGAAQRVFFCLVPDNTWQRKPDEVQWTAEEEAYLDRATALMQKLKGLARTPKLDKAIDEWVENIRQTLMVGPEEERNIERARFRFRSSEIAHTLGVIMHCCIIVQKMLDREDELREAITEAKSGLDVLKNDATTPCELIAEAERRVIAAQSDLEQWKVNALNLSQYPEEKASTELAVYAADYCLDTQDMLWSKRLRAQIMATCGSGETVKTRSRSDEDYQRLPVRFTIEELLQMNWKSPSAIKQMVARFQHTNLIRKVGTQDRKAIYEKTAA